jgi:hypothetical protein
MRGVHDLDLMGTYLPDDFSHSLNIPTKTLSVGGARQGKGDALKRLAKIFNGFDTQYLEPSRLIIASHRGGPYPLPTPRERSVARYQEAARLAARGRMAGEGPGVLRPRAVSRRS